MKRKAFAFGVACVFAVLALAQAAFAADAIVGTWKINVAKSKYNPANLAVEREPEPLEAFDPVAALIEHTRAGGREVDLAHPLGVALAIPGTHVLRELCAKAVLVTLRLCRCSLVLFVLLHCFFWGMIGFDNGRANI